MDANVIQSNYEKFKHFVAQYIKRPGTEKFLAWLDTTDFKDAPASTKYHLSEAGGLCKHSLDVFMRLARRADASAYDRDTLAFLGLLHDISKVGLYKKIKKNVKDANGQWVEVQSYSYTDDSDKLVYGTHQEMSLYILHKFFTTTYEEDVAILHHHGGFDADSALQKDTTSKVFANVPIAVMLHIADMEATYLDESHCTNNYMFGFDVVNKEEAVAEAPTVIVLGNGVINNVENKPNIATTVANADNCPF